MRRAFKLILLLITPALPAQSNHPIDESQIPNPGTLILKQEVRNVIVDIVATDKHGEPATFFSQPNFKVYENGVQQDIVYFEKHTESYMFLDAARQPTPQLPPNEFTNIETIPKDEPLMVLLLDAQNTSFSDQAYVRNQMLGYLKKIPPATHIAVFALGARLRLIQGFNEDAAVLKAALEPSYDPAAAAGGDALAANSPRGVPESFSASVAETRANLDSFIKESAFDYSSRWGNRYMVRAENTRLALYELTGYLSGIPGRKSLIWFAGSFPFADYPIVGEGRAVPGPIADFDHSKPLKKLEDIMNVSRVSIYPVDARGLGPPSTYSYAYSPEHQFAPTGTDFGLMVMNDSMVEGSEDLGMEHMAEATGGRAFYNNNDLARAISQVHSIGENYYTIAYSPKNKDYDGRFRKVEIKVNDPGIRLDYRRGYYASKPRGRFPLFGAMQFGAPSATELPIHVQVTKAAAQPRPNQTKGRIGNQGAKLKGPVVRYEFKATIDPNDVTLRQLDGRRHAQMYFALAAYDNNGKLLNDIYGPVIIDMNDRVYADALAHGVRLTQDLDLPAGELHVRVGVADDATKDTGATEFPLNVQPGPERVAQLR